MDRQAVRDLVTEIFEEEALLLGGVVTVHPVADDVIWRLVRGLDGLRLRFLRRLDEAEQAGSGPPEPSALNLKPHPAIEDFLLAIRRGSR